MPRRPNVIPSTQLCVMLPEDIRGWLDLRLFSEVEGRVPLGAYQEFFARKIREEKEWGTLILDAYGAPPGNFISGPKESLDVLKQLLAAKTKE